MRISDKWLFWLLAAAAFFAFLYLTRAILLPFVAGMMLAYCLDPAADRLESWRVPRGVAAAAIICGFLLIFCLALVLLVPLIAQQSVDLLVSLPDYARHLREDHMSDFKRLMAAVGPEHLASIEQSLGAISERLIGFLGEVLQRILQSGITLLNVLSLMFITPVVAFYLLRDWDRMVARLDGYLPRLHAPVIREQMRKIDDTLAGFIRGQINVCLLLGVFYAIGLSVAGLKYGAAVGLLTGLLTIIPYAGLLSGMVLGLLIALFQFDNWYAVGGVMAVFVIGQMIEGNFVTPRLVGEKVGLHPVWLIFGMLAGGALFGFVGILIGVPVTAVIGVLVRFGMEHYLRSSYYHGAPSASSFSPTEDRSPPGAP